MCVLLILYLWDVILPILHLYLHSSLEPLFENSRLDDELRQFVKKTFPEFCRQGTLYLQNVHVCMCSVIHVYVYIPYLIIHHPLLKFGK